MGSGNYPPILSWFTQPPHVDRCGPRTLSLLLPGVIRSAPLVNVFLLTPRAIAGRLLPNRACPDQVEEIKMPLRSTSSEYTEGLITVYVCLETGYSDS